MFVPCRYLRRFLKRKKQKTERKDYTDRSPPENQSECVEPHCVNLGAQLPIVAPVHLGAQPRVAPVNLGVQPLVAPASDHVDAINWATLSCKMATRG